jgi:type II secretory pathway pseudopilin PulG
VAASKKLYLGAIGFVNRLTGRNSSMYKISNRKNYRNQEGFTLVELMIASAVFSAVLILISMALLSIGRSFQRGLIASRTQDSARAVAAEISEAIKLSGSSVGNLLDNNGSKAYCVGNKRYSYVPGKQLTGELGGDVTPYALVVDEFPAGCPPEAQDLSAGTVLGRELLSQNMRLVSFNIDKPADLYNISITVAHTGSGDVIAGPDGDGYFSCDADSATSQFCAVSNLRTSVVPRLQ